MTSMLSPSAPLRKFLFDDPQPGEVDIPSLEDLEPLDGPVLNTGFDGSQETLDWERHQSFEQGRIQGRAEMEQQFYDHQQHTLQAIQKNIDILVQDHQDFSENLQVFLGKMMMDLLHKVLPGLESFCRQANIQAHIQQVVASHTSEPLLKLYLNPNTLGDLQPLLTDFSPSLEMHDDPALASSDCRIAWADGGFEYRLTHIMNALESLLQPPAPCLTSSPPMMEPDHD